MTDEAENLLCDQLGEVGVVSFRGDLLVVCASAPAPPGTRLTLREREGGDELVSGKITSVAAERPEPERWEVSIRLFGASRAAKELFARVATKR